MANRQWRDGLMGAYDDDPDPWIDEEGNLESKWRHAVFNGDARLGFADWLAMRKEFPYNGSDDV